MTISPPIDLRSDTVTRPTPAMRAAMLDAEVGDDVYGEDPSVAALEARALALFGGPDSRLTTALFVPTGVMANHIGLRMHAAPGEEVVCDADAHIVAHEDAGLAWHAGVQTRTTLTERGLLTADQLDRLVRPHGPYVVGTKVIELENTHNRGGGSVYPLETLREIRALADERGVKIHLDGARLWNAHVAGGTPLAEYGKIADTLSVCLSKGLGAPVGSILLLAEEQREQARVLRHRLGGGWRQAGMLAAAGLYALEHHIERMAEDHANARLLSEGLRERGLTVSEPETNILLIDAPRGASGVADRAREQGVLIGAMGPRTLRAITHLDVTEKSAATAAQIIADCV
ncbi:aminotransferase class I/II-fold pyridoxal phosphate-dependent enzyme [Actinospica sp. MGRD01-02]|uniref:Aminotransferase class I/II-fold pyridoxal phosphate-dependent enzyme n=1 Tax=Actinospica acidithermotolerans TaxID=2828514 RepID=A0A941E8I3_9ACTN|nr:GntG family PLP-dependent aldolase [Actinospica acidithermotolerans]MBR7826487.1 aminotransferase class I/II-fold pyridoxal phosphate-dependent enzyme [Actinospica acidithermotolerans]